MWGRQQLSKSQSTWSLCHVYLDIMAAHQVTAQHLRMVKNLEFTGLYSQVKRAPKAKIKRKTFETAGPGVEGAMSLDDRCTIAVESAVNLCIMPTSNVWNDLMYDRCSWVHAHACPGFRSLR